MQLEIINTPEISIMTKQIAANGYSLNGEIAINQVSATSKIHIPEKVVFQAVAKGIGTSISYEKAGQRAERFDTPKADNVIELNGIKSELIICMD